MKWTEIPCFSNIVSQLCVSSINLIPLKGELTIIPDLSFWLFQLSENRGSKKRN